MKNFKTLLALICLLAFANIGFAQSAKMQEKAAAKVEKINTQITSVNAELALTDEQRTQLTDLEIKRMKGVKEIKKGEGTEEEIKAKKKEFNKSISKEMNKEILTKDQRLARKEARQKSKKQ